MMAALWRESPLALIQSNQRVMTMAALLHQDRDGNALLPAMIQASGLETGEWLKRYLQSYLSPLLHCLYTYDLAFMPHGENLILVLENHTPVHVFMKDIAEEIVVMDPDADLPEKPNALRYSYPTSLKSYRSLPMCSTASSALWLRFCMSREITHRRNSGSA